MPGVTGNFSWSAPNKVIGPTEIDQVVRLAGSLRCGGIIVAPLLLGRARETFGFREVEFAERHSGQTFRPRSTKQRAEGDVATTITLQRASGALNQFGWARWSITLRSRFSHRPSRMFWAARAILLPDPPLPDIGETTSNSRHFRVPLPRSLFLQQYSERSRHSPYGSGVAAQFGGNLRYANTFPRQLDQPSDFLLTPFLWFRCFHGLALHVHHLISTRSRLHLGNLRVVSAQTTAKLRSNVLLMKVHGFSRILDQGPGLSATQG